MISSRSRRSRRSSRWGGPFATRTATAPTTASSQSVLPTGSSACRPWGRSDSMHHPPVVVGDLRAVEDVELDLAKRGRHLVLPHLDPRPAADDRLAVLDGADAADVEPLRGVELERVAAGGRLRVPEHDADLHPDLVDEDDRGV